MLIVLLEKKMPSDDSSVVVDGIRRIFADSYALYLKSQNYHWNVEGVHFSSLHALFEKQYHKLSSALDVLAERLRALGVKAPGTFDEIQSLATIKSGSTESPAERMLCDLLDGHSMLCQTITDVIRIAAGESDEGTVGLLSERLASHEKAAWMLRSSLP